MPVLVKKKIPLQFFKDVSLIIIVVDNYLDVGAYMIGNGWRTEEKLINEDDPIYITGYVHRGRNQENFIEYTIVVCLRTSPGQVAHEVRHFLNMVYEDIRQEYVLNNDELDCYLMTYFVDEIFGLILKENDKKSKREDAEQ